MHPIFTIDFETTGVDAKTCEPVEVAMVADGFEFESFIKPNNPIPPETSAIHHITDEDVDGHPSWNSVRNQLAYYVEAATSTGNPIPVLVAHNAEYEKAILLRPDDGDFPAVLWICTYKCALRIWPDAPGHKNEVLRYWLKLGDARGRNSNQRPHSALHDTKVTFLLLQALLEHATIEQLIEWSDLPAKLPRMPMGKHFGQTWDTVPGPYLQWCINQADMREDVKFCAREELLRRKGQR